MNSPAPRATGTTMGAQSMVKKIDTNLAYQFAISGEYETQLRLLFRSAGPVHNKLCITRIIEINK